MEDDQSRRPATWRTLIARSERNAAVANRHLERASSHDDPLFPAPAETSTNAEPRPPLGAIVFATRFLLGALQANLRLIRSELAAGRGAHKWIGLIVLLLGLALAPVGGVFFVQDDIAVAVGCISGAIVLAVAGNLIWQLARRASGRNRATPQ